MGTRVQNPVILPEQLLATIAAEGTKGGIDVDDSPTRVGHRDNRMCVDGMAQGLRFAQARLQTELGLL